MKTTIALIGLAAIASVAGGQTVTMLETLGGTGSVAEDINDLGQVVGYSTHAGDGTIEATIWNAGVASGLGFAAGANHSYANAINNNGEVVGYSETAAVPDTPGSPRTATYWGAGGPVDIGAQLSHTFSIAHDINNSGTVAIEGGAPGNSGGWAWNPLFGGLAAGADPIYRIGGNRGINDSNHMVGYAQAGFDGGQAIYTNFNGAGWDVGTEIGPQGVRDSAYAHAISNAGHVVGEAGDGVNHFAEAAMYTLDKDDPVVWLGKLVGFDTSTAFDVNSDGLIVGVSTLFGANGREDRAVAWVNGEIFDLSSALSESSGWTRLLSATGVNEHGDIVGYGLTDTGDVRGFVLTGFVPAPGTIGLLGLGGFAAARRRR